MGAKIPFICQAEHPEEGTLYAAVDSETRFVSGEVQGLRFASLLTPFRTEEEAWSALEKAGAVVRKAGAA